VLEALDERDRQKRLRPLRIFGVLAPLLLLIVGLFGFATVRDTVVEAERGVLAQKQMTDLMAAEIIADVVEEKLTRLTSEVELYAKGERLRKPLSKLLAQPAPDERQAELKEIEEFLQRISNFEKKGQVFFVCDNAGYLRAAYNRSSDPQRQHPREIYDRDYSYRDYFNRTGDLYHEKHKPHPYRKNVGPDGRDVPYIGQPSMSTIPDAEPLLAITISAPIYDVADHHEQQKIGLLGIAINMDELYHWIKPVEDSGATVVLLDRHGHCLHHQHKHRAAYQPRADEAPQAPEVYRQIVQRLQAIEQQSLEQEDHHDPYDHQLYLAHYAPIRPFGWGVIIQHEENHIRAEVAKVRASIEGWTWIGAGTSGLLLVVFWIWLLWILFHKETVVHG
jgi:hypothetical protein